MPWGHGVFSHILGFFFIERRRVVNVQYVDFHVIAGLVDAALFSFLFRRFQDDWCHVVEVKVLRLDFVLSLYWVGVNRCLNYLWFFFDELHWLGCLWFFFHDFQWLGCLCLIFDDFCCLHTLCFSFGDLRHCLNYLWFFFNDFFLFCLIADEEWLRELHVLLFRWIRALYGFQIVLMDGLKHTSVGPFNLTVPGTIQWINVVNAMPSWKLLFQVFSATLLL